MPKDEVQLQEQLERQRKKVDVEHFDITVRELVRMASEGELQRAPTYQRKFRWNEEQESRLIESVFLGLPVPSIFVASNPDGTWELVDGLQRLSTLIHFSSEDASSVKELKKEKPLRLQGLDKLGRFNNKTFTDLPGPLQLAFTKRALRVTALSDKSDPEVRFDMFERLNTGGVALTPQEVRACIFRGSFVDFLLDLSENDAFRKLVKLQRGRQEDGTYEELVLKFFAYLNDRSSFDGKVTRFLNDYMKKATASFDYESGRKVFNSVVGYLYRVLAGPFLRRGVHTTPLNQLEAVMVGCADIFRKGKRPTMPKSAWLNDAQLVKASTGATNTHSMLVSRITRATELMS